MTTHMKRTVVDPNRSVKAPTSSPQMVMVGCLPFQRISATTVPEELVIVVRRFSFLRGSSGSYGSDCFTKAGEDDAIVGEGDSVEEGGLESQVVCPEETECGRQRDSCSTNSSSNSLTTTVTISYALSPVVTSVRDVLSISGAVNLSNMMGSRNEGGVLRGKFYRWVGSHSNRHPKKVRGL